MTQVTELTCVWRLAVEQCRCVACVYHYGPCELITADVIEGACTNRMHCATTNSAVPLNESALSLTVMQSELHNGLQRIGALPWKSAPGSHDWNEFVQQRRNCTSAGVFTVGASSSTAQSSSVPGRLHEQPPNRHSPLGGWKHGHTSSPHASRRRWRSTGKTGIQRLRYMVVNSVINSRQNTTIHERLKFTYVIVCIFDAIWRYF